MVDKDETRLWVKEFLAAFSGQRAVLTIPRIYIEITGSLEAALLLSQIIYWTDRSADGWVAKSYIEWCDEICLSEYQVRKATKALEPLGVSTKLKKWKGAPTVHYHFDLDKFSEFIPKFFKNGNLKNSRMKREVISETYTEITSENTTETTTDIGVVFKTYENEIGTISPHIADELKDLAQDTPIDWIVDAIHEASTANTRKLSYIKGILKNWRVEGRKAKQDTGTAKTPRAALPSTLPDDVLPVLFQREKEAAERASQNGGHDE